MSESHHPLNPGRLLVVGGTGFLGSTVVEVARERGLAVVSVARGNRRGFADRYPDIVCDITRPERLRGVIAAGDTVLNLVGLSPVARPRGGRRGYYGSHTAGTRNLVKAADDAGAAALIYISALGVHRWCGAAYGETKAQAEQIVLTARTPGLIIAPSLLFGDSSEIVQALDLIARRWPLPGISVPNIDTDFRPIHVDDAARRIVDLSVAIGSGEGPVAKRNAVPLVGPERLTGYEIVARYLEARGIAVSRLPSPVSMVVVALLSRLKFPGLPAELNRMLALDNAGTPPEFPHDLMAYSRWVTPSHKRNHRIPSAPYGRDA
jgi:uncharacterized protein YbjT (DUF2867 family)